MPYPTNLDDDLRLPKRGFKIGLVLPQWNNWVGNQDAHWSDIHAVAQQAELVGFDSLWVTDHFQPRPGGGMWESWSVLAALAEATQRVEIGPLVANTGYRNPALLARTADTIEDISSGRLILGLGAGDVEREHINYGFQWDHRVSRFEEALQIIHPMLRTGQVNFSGDYYTAEDVVLKPRGPRKSGPPILIGSLGHGPRMLRLTMEFADLWNAWLAFGASTTDALTPILQKIDIACNSHERDPATLERTISVGIALPGHPFMARAPHAQPITGSPEGIAEQFQSFVDLGISHIIIMLSPLTIEGVDYIASVLDVFNTG